MRKSQIVKFRVTDDEYARLTKEANGDMSALLRSKVFLQQPVKMPKALKQAVINAKIEAELKAENHSTCKSTAKRLKATKGKKKPLTQRKIHANIKKSIAGIQKAIAENAAPLSTIPVEKISEAIEETVSHVEKKAKAPKVEYGSLLKKQ